MKGSRITTAQKDRKGQAGSAARIMIMRMGPDQATSAWSASSASAARVGSPAVARVTVTPWRA
jgi:hypothetical protein